MIKLFKYLKPHKRFAIFTIILAALSNVMTLGFPFMMQQLINNGITKGDLDYIKNIIDSIRDKSIVDILKYSEFFEKNKVKKS